MAEQGEIKTFHVTGEAAKSVGGFEKKRQRRTTRKKQEGGENQPVINIPSINQPLTVQKVPEPAKPVEAQIPRQPAPVAPILPPTPFAHQEGGVKRIKVELKKKTETKKVQLHPKKADAQKVQLVKKLQTRKARKVLLGVSSLHKRMTRAKKLHKKAKEMPIDKLKEELIKKKLIKPTSKAPETILRQIAADAQIVATKSL